MEPVNTGQGQDSRTFTAIWLFFHNKAFTANAGACQDHSSVPTGLAIPQFAIITRNGMCLNNKKERFFVPFYYFISFSIAFTINVEPYAFG